MYMYMQCVNKRSADISHDVIGDLRWEVSWTMECCSSLSWIPGGDRGIFQQTENKKLKRMEVNVYIRTYIHIY